MNEKIIQTSIDSYKARIRYEEQRAIMAITDGQYTIAALAIAQASSYKGAIEELEFLLDCMEVNNG